MYSPCHLADVGEQGGKQERRFPVARIKRLRQSDHRDGTISDKGHRERVASRGSTSTEHCRNRTVTVRSVCHRGWASACVTRVAEPRDSESQGARGSVSRPSLELGQAVSFTSPRITPEEVRQRPELRLSPSPPPSLPPSRLPRGVCPGQAAREGRPHVPNKSRRP